MFWPDEIRASDFEELDKSVAIRPQEVQMARSLIENLTDEFKPEEFKDEYREALLDVVEKKAAGEEIEVPEAPQETKVVDLMEALKASLAKGAKPSRKAEAEERPAKKRARG